MRDKKFRVWCKTKEEWENHRCFLTQSGELYHDIGGAYTRLKPLNPKTHIIQFYTGLKDKDDVEICEGDIVKIESGYSGDNFYKECIAVIKYDAPEFYPYNPKDKDGIVWQDECNYFNGFEIVGNIFENKDLIS